MKPGSTIFLKIVVFLVGIIVLALCIFWLPAIANGAAEHYPKLHYWPVLIGAYLSAIPFFAALYQALRLLGYIDRNKAFSELSVTALKNIKHCAITISIIYAVLIPFLVPIANADDAPGIVALGLVIAFASFVIAVFAAVLQKLLKDAVDIKSDNDLTI
ncbi:putative toxin of a toxin / antitoxin system [Clostridiaceae bacterium BL-3]|jgi:uncharacterized membrane protein (DUF485 family)|nr:putative toxin of a toxin / antitoxin system [Clostridiaceae bacterium BL-3]